MRAWIMLAVAVLAVGCKGKNNVASKGRTGAETVLAQVDNITITSADVKDHLARYANQPFALARYSSLEKKKELLENIIRTEVLALEARKRGYENDPEVLRATRDKMVKVFTQKEITEKVKPSDISDAEIEKYYKEHASEFSRAEMARASQILVKEKPRALKALAEAKALPKADMKGFRDLVTKYTEDADSKPRGGDLMQLERGSTLQPPEVIAAVFALKEVGDLSDLVSTDKGFVILKLTDKRPPISRSLAEAKPEIQRRLVEDLRNSKKKEYVDTMRKLAKVEIFEDQLAALDVAATVTAGMPKPSLDGGVMAGPSIRISR